MEKEGVYEHVKRVIIEEKIDYPEKALYDNFLKYNAEHWFKPKKCSLRMCNFGISVIPEIYDCEIHSRVVLNVYHDGLSYMTRECLGHQIYLGDLVLKLWQAESEGKKCEFTITCVRKQTETIKL